MNDQENKPVTLDRSRFKFGLRQLFYAIALVAAGLALSSSTIWFSAAVLLSWGIFFSFSSLRGTRLGWGLLLLFVVSLSIQTDDYQHHYDSNCRNNLKIMALEILNYETMYGRFPTDRLVTLANGTELRHSWRIEILPFIEQNALYARYDFKEAWNGPNNSKLESLMPDSFTCPYRDHGTKTPYKLVNGPGTAFEVGSDLNFSDVTDGSSNTIGLIEDHANPANWMEPGDFTAQDAARAMNSITMRTAAHRHESLFKRTAWGCNFATMDASTYRWPPLPDEPMDPRAFLIDDGYVFDFEASGQSLEETKYGASFILAIYLLLIVLPAFFVSKTNQRLLAENTNG